MSRRSIVAMPTSVARAELLDTPSRPGHCAGHTRKEPGIGIAPRADHRRNVLAYIGDYLFFGAGMSFASQTTVLPSLVRALTYSAPLVGLVSTLATGGWLIPQLFAANHIAGRPRLKSAVLAPAIVGRVLFLLLPPALLLLAPGRPGAALAVFFVIHFVFWALDGVASVSWLDLMGRLLTAQERARMFSAGMAASSALGIGVGIVVTVVLASPRLSFPSNYALLLALSSLFFSLSAVAFWFVREQPLQTGQRPLPWPSYFRRLFGVIRGDHDFRRVVAAQLVLGTCQLAMPFYVLFGVDRLGFAQSSIGTFLSFQVVGSLCAGLGLGRLAERRGSRSVMRLWSVLATLMPVAALAFPLVAGAVPPATLPFLYAVVFLVVGAQGSANMTGFISWVLEYAPASERPMYIGFANALSGTSLVMPIIGGLVVSAAGYPALFAVAAAAALAGLVLTLRVMEPRHRTAAALPERPPSP
ncbi:MAG: MFS transporter [Spirochaetes bacterium]|nr:MFS transporter [Spirochaetota bacterium]